MINIYMKRGCPYCKKVLDALHEEIGIPFAVTYISDDTVADELIERGGKRMVPYLVDDSTGTEMYESDDIVEYLKNTYPAA